MQNSKVVDITSLVGLEVKHNVNSHVRKSFGVGNIIEVANNKICIQFASGDKKLFQYPMCFSEFISFTKEVPLEIEDMIECDLDGLQSKVEKEKEDFLIRIQDFGRTPVIEHNFWAVKRPYLDLDCSCSKVQMKNNVNAKYTVCQKSLCKDCVLGKGTSFEDLSLKYSKDGGCPESLMSTTLILEQSTRSKVNVGDVLVFTCIPDGCREQDRLVYGFTVVESVTKNENEVILSLNKEKTCILDYDIAIGFKFWDVMVNVKKPEVMLFGNSHSKKLTDMQASQYVKMICSTLEHEEVSLLTEMCGYIGIGENEIKENKGALVLLEEASESDIEDDLEENIDTDEIFVSKVKPSRVIDEDVYDDIDDI